MQLPEEQVVWVAQLAQIELSEEEKRRFAGDLSNTISYIDELAAVDVSGVSDAEANNSQITGLTNVMALDELANCEIPREEFLTRAPMREGSSIKVRKVL